MSPFLGQAADDLPMLIAIILVGLISTVVNVLRNRKGAGDDDPVESEQVPGTPAPPPARPVVLEPRATRSQPQAARAAAPRSTRRAAAKPPAATAPAKRPPLTVSQRQRRRRRNLQKAVLWSEILQPPVALREEDPWC